MRRMRHIHWSSPLTRRCCSVLVAVVLALAPAAIAWTGTDRVVRKVPGPSPRQTIDNVLQLVGDAESAITAAVEEGIAAPGWTFSPDIHRRVANAELHLTQATQSLDLIRIPSALLPMTGVARLLQLYSLLRYDLAQHPGLPIPDQQQVKDQQLSHWTLPDSAIALRQIAAHATTLQQLQRSCSQCSVGDFLFTAETVAQVPQDFDALFANDPVLRHRYGGQLYEFWAQLPGGALPPKLFFLLSPPLRRALLTTMFGQSLLQWLLLIPVTIVLLMALVWWLWVLRNMHRQANQSDGARIHLLRAAGLIPPLLLVRLWQWYAVDWVNLFAERQEAVVIGSTVVGGGLMAAFVYLLAEAIGQQFAWTSAQHDFPARRWIRRRGSGQIMTLARIAGVVAGLVVLIRTGRDLGLTSVTLLALSSVPALAISLGTQQLIHDIADGFSLLLDGQIKPGSYYLIGSPKAGEIQGRISSLGMRSLRLELEDGSIVAIPNSQVASSVVTSLPTTSASSVDAAMVADPAVSTNA